MGEIFLLTKKEFRKQMKEKLTQLSKEIYEVKSQRIAEKLFETEEWKMADTIGITISIPPEVNTYRIIEKAWSEQKRVAVPKCVPESRQLDFYYIQQFEHVEKGYFGLFEPNIEKVQKADIENIDLLFIPGLAYTVTGCRLGFGGGYYDRYLPNFPNHTVVLAFQEQIVDHLPIEKHDYKVKKIITDQSIYRINDCEQ
jgi:5-formyltetrahydrofolate cyclo-ligase